MPNFQTPEHAAAYVLGMTLDAYTRMVDAEVAYAESEEAEAEHMSTRDETDNPRFLTEWDLPGEEDNPEEVAQINEFWEAQAEYAMNRAY